MPTRLGALDLIGAYELRSTDPAFGGISGARLAGTRLLLLSDRSRLFELTWPAHRAGMPFDLPVLRRRTVATATGDPLDAEALVLAPDGAVLVADETNGLVFKFPTGGGTPQSPPRHVPGPFAAHRPTNEGVETLARLPDGSLLAIAEGAWLGEDLHAAVRVTEGGFLAQRYRAAAGFQPTDADVAGDQLFVLERRVSLLGGWQARIVAIGLSELPDRPDGVIVAHELARVSGSTLGENYEALAASPDRAGGYRLLVVSDDNFNALQRTQLLELAWRP